MGDCVARVVRTRVERGFSVIGREAGKKSWWAVAICAVPPLILVLLSLGALSLEWESNATYLWVCGVIDQFFAAILSKIISLFQSPRGIPQRERWEYLKDEFPVSRRLEQFYLSSKGNIATTTGLGQAFRLHEFVTRTASVKVDGKEIDFDSVCVKLFNPRSEAPCEVFSLLSLWNFNRTEMELDPSPAGTIANAEKLGLASLGPFLGGISRDENGTFTGARVLAAWYALQEGRDGVLEWEAEVIDRVQSMMFGNVEVDLFLARSFDDEVLRSVEVDVPLFVIALVLLVTYLSLTLGPISTWVDGRYYLGLFSLVSVLLAFGSALGVLAMVGIKANSIIALCAFVLAGVSADNLIVITDVFDHEVGHDSLPDRLAATMKHAGTSISLTSISTVVAFAAGSSSPLIGVEAFSVVAAFAFAFNFFLQITTFPVLLAIDSRRVEENRHSCFPCFSVETFGCKPIHAEPVRSKSGNHIPRLTVARRLTRYLGQAVTFPPVAVGVVVGFLVIMVLSLTVVDDIRVGLEPKDVVPDDSYVTDAFGVATKYFDLPVFRMSIVLKDLTLSEDERARIHQLEDDLANVDRIFPPVVGWLDVFEAYANDTLGGVPADPVDIRAALDNWLHNATTCPVCSCDCREFQSSVVLASASDVAGGAPSIVRSLFEVDSGFPSGAESLEYDKEVNGLIADNDLDGFAFADNFLYEISDFVMPRLTLEAMAVTAAAVCGLLLLLLPALAALFVAVVIFALDSTLFGYIYVLDIQMNAVILVTVILGVGLAVDEASHVVFRYIYARGRNQETGDLAPVPPALCSFANLNLRPSLQQERSKEALEVMGSSVLKGAFTTFLGIIVLSGSNSGAFRTFFLVVVAILVLGAVYGLIFSPAALSLIGVCAVEAFEDEEEPEDEGGVDKNSAKGTSIDKDVEVALPPTVA